MSIGLLALLDDVTALVKASAALLDDIPAQVAKAGGKVSGIVIDDAAVTPKYVVGLDPKRELIIIYNIAKKSMFNKLVLLGPSTLFLGLFVPWIIPPILMIGGAYLCFEGYQKIQSIFKTNIEIILKQDLPIITSEELEKIRTKSAVRTDFILSAEIMAITFTTVSDTPVLNQILVLFSVAVAVTIVVYGAVAIIVKTDDMGLSMAAQKNKVFIQKFGRSIVKLMPHFLKILGYIGTMAMLWIGAEIIIHGIPFLYDKLNAIGHVFINHSLLVWVSKATVCAVVGIFLGAVITQTVMFFRGIFEKFKPA